MSESEVRQSMVGSNRSRNVYNLSIALAPHLGIPTDVIEQALIKAIEQNSANIVNALPSSLHNNSIQDSKPVSDLSQCTALIPPGSNHDVHPSILDIGSKNHTTQEYPSQSYQKNRKDSLSSLIEITQSGSTSINIKLPSLHVPPPTIQGEMTNGQNNLQPLVSVNTGPFDENLNRPQYYDEPKTHDGPNNVQNRQIHDFSISPQREDNHVQDIFTPEGQDRQIDSTFDAFKEYIPQQQREPRVQDKYNVSNQDQQIGHDVSKEFNQRQQSQTNGFQDDSYTPEVRSRQINSTADFSEEYTQPQRREFHDPYKTFPQVVSPIKNNSPDSYLSEFPSLSEAAKKSDSRKNSGVDLGAWGQMDLNIASAWGKPKKWSSETETNTFESPTSAPTWNPDTNHSWRPIQEPKPPINKKKPQINFDTDDGEGWGAPPANSIPWNDIRQGYCVDLIEEQKETVFWSMQNGNWVNVSEEYSKTVEYTSDGYNHKNIRQKRTQTQRIERQEATWDEDDREQNGHSSNNNETIENTANKIMINLSDHSNDNSDSSEIENHLPNSDTTTGSALMTAEDSRERLGNPQWKDEKEWSNQKLKQEVECGDLINLNISESKGSESDREENGGPNEEISNWDSRLPEEVNNDSWFTEDVQKEMTKGSDQDLLINIDSSYDNEVTESTIINTHPPIFHGRVNNEMAEDLNDILFDTNPANTANVDTVNNELSLLSFDDDENKASNSPVVQENKNNSINMDDIEAFLKDKPPAIKNTNKLQDEAPITPYVINENSDISHNGLKIETSSSAPSYYCEDPPQANIESVNSSSTIVIDERNHYGQVPDQFELDQYKDSINEPRGAADPNSNEPDSNSTKVVADDKDFIINLTVETPYDGRQILRLRHDDDPILAATEFCTKWNMLHFEDALKGFVQKEQKRRLRKRRTKCKK